MQKWHLVTFLVCFGSLFCNMSKNSFIQFFLLFSGLSKIFNQKIYLRERFRSNNIFAMDMFL